MSDYLASAGPAGMAVAISASALLIAGALMVALSCTRKAFALYALLIWMPLLFGTLGTRTALNEMENSPLTRSDAIGPRNQQRLRTQLKRPLNLGIGATALLVPLAVIGLATARKRNPGDGNDPQQPADQV